MREFLAREFMGRGRHVLLARNAQETLEMTSNSPVDLIIIDVDIPNTNGADAIRSLRRSGLMTPVLVLAYNAEEAADCLKEQQARFVEKCEDVEPLMRAVDQTLRSIPAHGSQGLSYHKENGF